MFSIAELETLLEAQSKLNSHYVEDWLIKIHESQFKTALLCELAEFFESSPRLYNHKWWKPYLENDIQNAKIEIIDILHFGLSILLIRDANSNPNKKICFNRIASKVAYAYECENLNYTMPTLDNMLQSIMKFLKTKQNVIDHSLTNAYLFVFLKHACEAFDYTFDDLYKGYFLKNELNLKRINNGYMVGDYNKVDKNGNEDNRSLKV